VSTCLLQRLKGLRYSCCYNVVTPACLLFDAVSYGLGASVTLAASVMLDALCCSYAGARHRHWLSVRHMLILTQNY